MAGPQEREVEYVHDDPSLVLGDDDISQANDDLARSRRGRRILIVLGLVVLLMIGSVAAAIYVLTEQIGSNMARVPNVFGPLQDTARPRGTAALTFLLVGTDSRSVEPTTGTDASPGVNAGSQRSDVLMMVQLAPDRRTASVVSIPRDSWVEIPGRGHNKINAAYALGGPPLLIQTVERLTSVHIDHFAVIDFAGFQAMVDAVGGINVQLAAATSSGGVAFRQGLNHLDGAQALTYVRQRYDLPRGDLDRNQRQQNALRALLSQAASSGALTDSIKLFRLLDATSRSVSVDDTLSNSGLRSLAFDSRGLRPAGVTFLNAPVGGFGQEGTQSVVYLDLARTEELWAALRSGTTLDYAAAHPDDRLGVAPP